MQYYIEFKQLDSVSDYPSVKDCDETFTSLGEIAKFVSINNNDSNFKLLGIKKLVQISEAEEQELANLISKENREKEARIKLNKQKEKVREENFKKQTEELQYKLYLQLRAKFETDIFQK